MAALSLAPPTPLSLPALGSTSLFPSSTPRPGPSAFVSSSSLPATPPASSQPLPTPGPALATAQVPNRIPSTTNPHPSPAPAPHHSSTPSFHHYPNPSFRPASAAALRAPGSHYPRHSLPSSYSSPPPAQNQPAPPAVPFPTYTPHPSYPSPFPAPPSSFVPSVGTTPSPLIMRAYQQPMPSMLPPHQADFARQPPPQIPLHRSRTPSASSQTQPQIPFAHAFPPGQNPYAASYFQPHYMMPAPAPYHPYVFPSPLSGQRSSTLENLHAASAPASQSMFVGTHSMYAQSQAMRGSSHSVNSQSTGRQTSMGLRVRTDSNESSKRPFPPLGPNANRARTDSQTSTRSATGRSSASGSLPGSGPNSPLSSSGTLGLTPPIQNSISGRKSSPLAQQTFGGSARKGLPRDPMLTDDDDASSSDAGKQGHRSTPGTSVDSTSSAAFTSKPPLANFSSKLPPAVSVAKASGHGAPDRSTAPQRQVKQSLSNKLRKALSMGALQEAASDQEHLNEVATVVDDNKSQTGSVAEARSVTPSMGSVRRMGLFNLRKNGSTDNLSISSTVSSASVMIRKLGSMGKVAKRSSVLGLTKMFKENNKPGKLSDNQPVGLGKASTSVHQITAEIDREATTDLKGMTPAAALVHKQKQQFAEQDALAAARAAATLNTSLKPEFGHSKGLSWSSKLKTTDDATTDAKRRALEQERERLKSRKGRKWGFGGGSDGAIAAGVGAEEQRTSMHSIWGGSISIGQHQGGKTSDELGHRFDHRVSTTDGEEDLTITTTTHGMESTFHDDADDQDILYEELAKSDALTDGELLDDYDAPSLKGFGDPKLRPRPPREAAPAKGILKNAKNFVQEDVLNRQSGVTGSLTTKRLNSYESREELRSESPSLIVVTPSPYAQPGANNSAPVVAVGDLSAPKAATTSNMIMHNPTRSIALPISASSTSQHRRTSFAQNLSVHSTWPPAIYDRRGEAATCNRLTPALAQQIKEELNAFKMEEMLVHQTSRVHTHFMR